VEKNDEITLGRRTGRGGTFQELGGFRTRLGRTWDWSKEPERNNFETPDARSAGGLDTAFDRQKKSRDEQGKVGGDKERTSHIPGGRRRPEAREACIAFIETMRAEKFLWDPVHGKQTKHITKISLRRRKNSAGWRELRRHLEEEGRHERPGGIMCANDPRWVREKTRDKLGRQNSSKASVYPQGSLGSARQNG